MKIQFLSDTHFETHEDHGAAFVRSLDRVGDVLVLAGDITTQVGGIFNAMKLFAERFDKIVYVPGNHEFWGADRQNVRIAMRKSRDRLGVHALWNETAVIDGVRFCGTTLWFPKTPMALQLQRHWSDFVAIPGAMATAPIRTRLQSWPFEENEMAVRFLRSEVLPGDVVVTHHLPSRRSIDPLYEGHDTNCFYVNELDDLIRHHEPALWIHGHTHASQDYQIGSTRVVCNPYGYQPSMLNDRWARHWVVEVDPPDKSA